MRTPLPTEPSSCLTDQLCGVQRSFCSPSSIGYMTAMHHLVQCERKKALAVCREFPLTPFRWRLGRLIEILFAERIQNLEILFTKLPVLRSQRLEGGIRIGVCYRLRILAEVLLP